MNKKYALVYNSTNGKPEELTVSEAINALQGDSSNAQHASALMRLIRLNKAVNAHNGALLNIAYCMYQIAENEDFYLYGYSSISALGAGFYGYKNSSVSQMVNVARNFLEIDDFGQARSVFYDSQNDCDFPVTCLSELLLDKNTMQFRKDDVISLYKALIDGNILRYDFTQKKIREIVTNIKEMCSRGLPLNSEKYIELTTSKQQTAVAQQQNGQQNGQQQNGQQNGQQQNGQQQNGQQQPVISDMDKFNALFADMVALIGKSERSAEMIDMLADFLNNTTTTKSEPETKGKKGKTK